MVFESKDENAYVALISHKRLMVSAALAVYLKFCYGYNNKPSTPNWCS